MPAIITKEMSSRRLGDFINTIKDEKKLFLGLGKRSTTWTGNPDQINNTVQEKIDFWDELIGVKKVAIKDVIPMIVDRQWTSGTSYVIFDPTIETSFDDEFYVVNTSYEVWKCTTAGGGTSTEQPFLSATETSGGVYTAPTDGYVWTYQYKVNRYEYQQTPSGWLSINYGDSIDEVDTDQNLDAFIELGTRYLLIRVEIEDPDLTGNEFSAGEFRQVGLVSHPRLTNGDLVINNYEPLANLTDESGFLVYLENREPESVISGQNTDLKITLRF